MVAQAKLPGRREWTSLSVLAGAALAGGPATAYATIVSHGPTGFPILLPGGHSITISRSFTAGLTEVTSRTAPPNVHEIATLRTHSLDARLIGVTFAAHLAAKGQTFNAIGPGGAVVAGHRFVTNRVRITARTNASHPNFSTVAQLVFDRTAALTRNKNFSILGTTRHETGIRASGSRVNTSIHPPPYSHEYALFRFDVGPQTDYGWLELSLSYAATGEPDFTISAYAYDTSGKTIPAGSVPEPQDLPLAMSALTLGALGLREWRKCRTKPDA